MGTGRVDVNIDVETRGYTYIHTYTVHMYFCSHSFLVDRRNGYDCARARERWVDGVFRDVLVSG